jgi:sulfate adenylyltransferase (ADP) / ATP adenylyltransferase
VAHLSPTHVCLLNKFNVVAHHVLVVTREFEQQTSPLNAADFDATLQVLQVGCA